MLSNFVLKPFRDDSALRALSTLRGLRGAPEVPPLCRETQSLGQHMLEHSCENATVGTNGLIKQAVRNKHESSQQGEQAICLKSNGC